MQQSKALYLKIFFFFFFHFIIQKQKMLEITSNFRISLDLFELASFAMNYGLQMANKTITGCTKVALPYFGPFPVKRRLEMTNTLVFFSENLTLQNPLGPKVQRIEIWRF